MNAVFVQICGWAAYAFGPIISVKLLYDTIKGNAHNTYSMLGAWIASEILALYYNLNRPILSWPIIANCIVSGLLISAILIVQKVKGKRASLSHGK